MSYEIDFLPVGDPGDDGKCKRSGDAIALRYGILSGPNRNQTVVIIDGGFRSSGEKLVAHIQRFYGTDTVDFVFSSHPHDDHIQGLFEVIEKLKVGTLLMHKPWAHAAGVQALLDDNRTTYTGTKRRLRESFSAARDLHALALRKGIKVVEPFQGTKTQNNSLHVLGPSIEFYQRCIAADLAEKPLDEVKGLGPTLLAGLGIVARAITESWDKEALAEPASDAVEPLNHSSTIIHLDFGDTKALLTADAGVQALNEALNYATSVGIDTKRCSRYQVPHHGSKRNIGPSILNTMIGAPLPSGSETTKTAMISSAKDGEPKHPSARVTNSFLRRGASPTATKGETICWHSTDVPIREGWIAASKIGFKDSYQDED